MFMLGCVLEILLINLNTYDSFLFLAFNVQYINR